MGATRWLVLAALLGGCVEEVSETVPADYTTWRKFTAVGPAPGHADSYRVIYVSDEAFVDSDFRNGYPMGTTIVKEIRDNLDGEPGDLRYLALMRRKYEIDTALEQEGGWLFTQADRADAPEVYRSLCWGRCHVAAPYNGAFYDYRAP